MKLLKGEAYEARLAAGAPPVFWRCTLLRTGQHGSRPGDGNAPSLGSVIAWRAMRPPGTEDRAARQAMLAGLYTARLVDQASLTSMVKVLGVEARARK